MFSNVYQNLRHEIGTLAEMVRRGEYEPLILSPHDPRLAGAFWLPAFGTGGDLDRHVLAQSKRMKTSRFGGGVFAIVPLYATSICQERCLYCNYRAANTGVKIDRIRLDDDDLLREAKFLMDEKGFRVLELVYATDPRVRVDAMCRHLELVKEMLEERGGGMVGINAESFDEPDYRRFAAAGADFSVVWMETYDRERYITLHPGGAQGTKKSNFGYRLDTYERMLAGGMRAIGMGVLSGLSDWRFDWAMLMYHEEYLREHYGADAAILGVPRLKPAAAAEVKSTEFIPTDQQFRLALALHNVFSPETLPFVSTREEWDLCVEMAAGGGCLFTFNCSTIPGGYTLAGKGEQFATGSYDVETYVPELRARGFDPVMAWEFSTSALAVR